MAMVPLVGQLRGDALCVLVAVDDSDNVAQMIDKVCVHSIGTRVRDREGVGKTLYHGEQSFSHDTPFEQTGIQPMDYVEVRFDDDES
jgi:hypothetical protein